MFRHLVILSLLLSFAITSAHGAAEPEIEGFTEPFADIELAASEMGILAAIDVKEGDIVEAGQLLASLDDSVLQAALNVAHASRNSRGQLKSAIADLEMRELELEKLTELRSRDHASQQEVDRVAGEVRIAAARVQAVREEIEVRNLEYERIRAQLRRRQIRSTIDGVVTDIFREQGEFVSPSQPNVVRVVQLDPLRIVFSVPIEQRSKVVAGQQVALTIGAAGESATATVEFVSPTADASSGTFRVKVQLPNPDGQWQAGDRSVLLLDQSPEKTKTPQILARRPR